MNILDSIKRWIDPEFDCRDKIVSKDADSDGFYLTFTATARQHGGTDNKRCDGASLFATDRVDSLGLCMNHPVCVARAIPSELQQPSLGTDVIIVALCARCADELMPNGVNTFTMYVEIDIDELEQGQSRDQGKSDCSTRGLSSRSGSRQMFD